MSRRIGILILVSLMTFGAAAIDTGKAFDDPELQGRYERLIAEVRCVTCQNQSIKDSNAFIAADLRREIRRLMAEGNSDAEIKDFLVTRYGDFVLYRPRFDGGLRLLWLAPLFLMFARRVRVGASPETSRGSAIGRAIRRGRNSMMFWSILVILLMLALASLVLPILREGDGRMPLVAGIILLVAGSSAGLYSYLGSPGVPSGAGEAPKCRRNGRITCRTTTRQSHRCEWLDDARPILCNAETIR